ncbi:MAG: sugar ABC transporter permease [Firmicutes bacterium]|nr:sugar ABC transporter permease [Bacillota bacterium]
MKFPRAKGERRRKLTLKGAERRAALIFLLPYIIGFSAFILIPFTVSFILIFMEYDVFSPPRFIGMANLTRMVYDPNFWHTWRVTGIYAVIGIVYTQLLGLAVALILYNVKRVTRLWRAIYYLPAMLAGTAATMVQGAVWAKDGMVNAVLRRIGIQGPAWLQDAHWALPALILMGYWTIGNMVLIFLAGRSNVPRELYEVAQIDGAGAWQTFRKITLPMMTPVILFNLILGVIGALQSFTQVYILTQGGPAGATRLVVLYLYYQAFEYFRLGYASSLAWSLLAVTMILSLLLLMTSNRWVYYETGGKGW